MVAPKNPGGKERPAGVPADTSRLQASDETAKVCDALDIELAELKARFDQYFLGLERFSPEKDRESLKKRINQLRTSHIRNTAMKFRVQAVWQKYLSYERMWTRIQREIEEGTYSRDLFKARMRNQKRDPKKKDRAGATTEEVDLSDLSDLSDIEGGSLEEALAEASAAVAKPAPKPAPPAAPPVPTTGPQLGRPGEVAPRPQSESGARPPPPPPGLDLVRPAPVAQRPQSESGARPPPPPPSERSAATPAIRPAGPNSTPATPRPAAPAARTPSGPPAPPPVETPARAISTPGSPRPPSDGLIRPAPTGARPPPPPAATVPPRPPATPAPLSGSAARPAPPSATPAPRAVSNPSLAAAPRGATPPPAPRPAPPAPGPAVARPGGAALPDEKMRAIYNAYVSAKRQCKEPTEGLTYESVSRSINQQMPELLKQHNAKAVDFKVVIKNGKASLKAVPKP